MDRVPSPVPRLNDLTTARYVLLRTFRSNGSSAQTPVWSVPQGDRLWVWTQANSIKVKRLRADPRCELAPCNATGRVDKGAFAPGRARVIDDPAAAAAAFALVRAKYGWQATVMALVIKHLRGAARMTVIEIDASPGR